MQCLRRFAQPSFLTRSFTTLSSSPVRPSLTPLLVRRPTTLTPSGGLSGTERAAAADVLPSTAVSSHPSLGQMRFGPRNTMNGHTRLVQKRRHGFLHRMRSKSGRRILLRRRLKGRKYLAQ